MYRKKLAKACLVTALAVTLAATSMSTVLPGRASVVQAEESVTMNIQFKDGAEAVAGGDYTVPAGVQNYSVLEQYVPEGYKMITSGDFYAEAGGKLVVNIEKIATDVTMNIQFKAGDEVIAGGDYTVPAGVQNYSVLEQYVPEGYKMTTSGDFYAEAGGKLVVNIEKIATDVTMNIQFKDGDEVVAGGDYTVPAGVQNYSVLTQYVPAGYQMTASGDFYAEDGGKLVVNIEKIAVSSTINVVFVDENGNNLGGGDFTVDADGDGIFNLSELTVPEGYALTVAGDQFVKDYVGETKVLTVKKILKSSIIKLQFVDENENVVGGGDYFVDADGDGIFNWKEIEVPAGYKLAVTGDAFVKDYSAVEASEVRVEKIDKGTIINVTFTDPQGNSLGGGDYLVDLDGDGIANYSELALPVGYKLNETGDFFVEEGAHYTIVLNREGAAMIHVVFKSEGGKNLGGGDFFVDADGDGIANYSELTLPEGYELIETGDFFVDTEKTYEITLNKEIEGTIINVVYVDENGNNLGGGDYFVDKDDDGIANYSELDLPEGYELKETGDFFVVPGKSYTIELAKIPEGKMINVVFVDEDGNNLGGGDYIVDEDGDGIANYSELDLPVGYELIVTGDFFVEDGGKYTITLKMRETILTVTFEDTEGNVVGKETLEAGVPGSPEDTHHFVLGEDFQLPEGYQLADGVDQITDIEIPYGSVGGHTMIVEKVASETPEDPTTPEEPENPQAPEDDSKGETVSISEESKKADSKNAEDKNTAPRTGDTSSAGAAAAAAGVSLAAIAAVIAKKRK